MLYSIAGLAYIGHSFTLVLAPALAGTAFNLAAAPVLIGETSLALYLLIRGVDTVGWNRRHAR